MNLGKVKIWVGVGAYVLAATTAIATPAPALEPEPSSQLTLASTGESDHTPTLPLTIAASVGEAGESGEDGTPVQPTSGAAAPSSAGEAGESGEAAAPAFVNKLTNAQLATALRGGGHIIFFRHSQTERDYADQVTADPMVCGTQRVLSEQGWQQARGIGQAFRDLRIPVGEVVTSQYCRAWQTADLAFGRYRREAALNFAQGEEYTDAQKAQMRAGIMPYLTAVPTGGTNTVLVGHDDVFNAATGIYPEPQGVAFILKPDGRGGFEILAKILANEWAQLPR